MANINKDISLIEKYGLSVYNLDDLPSLYSNSNFEWNMRLTLSSKDRSVFLCKLNEAI